MDDHHYKNLNEHFVKHFWQRLTKIYGRELPQEELHAFLEQIDRNVKDKKPTKKWDERDVLMITYGDSIRNDTEPALQVLHRFLNRHLKEEFSFVHLLPFFPYSSDDGFSVINYMQVNPELGDWDDIIRLSEDYKLMTDLVINHISKSSQWFQNYLRGEGTGKDFFIEEDPATDLSLVIRPRSLPLLTPFETSSGIKYLWTTFSDDQIDLNFANPAVLLEMVKVILFYLKNGASMIRMDAIAFLWKEPGTSSLHLAQTHEIVKLMRDVMEAVDPNAILLTETNVPNKENLEYFGHGDEAHMVYQFSLPPLLLHALHVGHSKYFNQWVASLPELPPGCTYFNFTASHDGIGMRPLEGLLPEEERESLIYGMKQNGGVISTRRNNDGTDSAYEINITYFDAMKTTVRGEDDLQKQRFLASQTIMLELQGLPAFYIHSLLATVNYHEGVNETGRARTINRRKWDEQEIETQLAQDTTHAAVLTELKIRINIRKKQKAFHPEARQEIIEAGEAFIALRRSSADGKQRILCITNITPQQEASLPNLLDNPEETIDLFTGQKPEIRDGAFVLEPYQTLWLEGK
ncbi:MAG TPA: sugar phosphorylase [Bacteroidales bacterium]|nr:sugar phosphorylase [Bacteroidales bacterium]